jgi:hypothetical protein
MTDFVISLRFPNAGRSRRTPGLRRSAVIVLGSGDVASINCCPGSGFSFGRPERAVRVFVLVARFLQVMLQLFLRLTPALPDSADLLRRWRRMGMLVRTMAVRRPVVYLAHISILPPE